MLPSIDNGFTKILSEATIPNGSTSICKILRISPNISLTTIMHWNINIILTTKNINIVLMIFNISNH